MNQICKKEKCSIHYNFDIQFASLTKDSENPLKCQICMLKDQMKHYFISIPEVLSQDDTLPIQNWPSGIEENLLEFLVQNANYSKKEQIENKVLTFYKDLQSQILDALEQAQKQSMEFIDQCLLGENDLIEFYNQRFKRKELKRLFENKDQNLEEQYQRLLRELEQSKDKDLDELSKKIRLFEDIDNLVCFDQSQQIKQVIDSIQSRINFFSPSLIDVQQMQMDENQENINSDQDSIVNGIISSQNLFRFNNIKSTIISNIRLLQQQFQSGKRELDDFVQEINQNQQIKAEQSEVILKTIEKTQEILQTYKKEISEERRDAQMNHIQSQFALRQQQQELQQLNDSIRSTNVNNTSQHFQFTQSAYSLKKKILIGKDNKQNLVVNCPNLGYSSATVYSNAILKKNKTYLLRFSFDQPFYSYYNVCIGLIDQTKINSWIGDSNQRILNGDNDGSFSKLIKGNFIGNSSNKEDIKNIEMRVCINDGIIQYSDYPSYENILQNKEEINKELDYRICIGFCWTYSAIVTLTHYQELDNFIPFV